MPPEEKQGAGAERRAPRLGARWDDSSQNARLRAAFEAGLIDFAEVNYPTSRAGPLLGDLPQFVHCPVNCLANPLGFNRALARLVKDAADLHDSPWVGEHLCWTSPGADGRLGYIINPPLCHDLVAVSVANIRELQAFYGRPIALELAPYYHLAGEMESELTFLNAVADGADARILFDIAHWSATNRNLGREHDFGLDHIDRERIIEVHIAGIRSGTSGRIWHDSHIDLPDERMLDLLGGLVDCLPALQAVTFEHDPSAPEDEFLAMLEKLRTIVGPAA